MFRTRHARRPDRRGAVLMVVLALLALFAVVGLSFVLLAESEATASRINKDALAKNGEEPPNAALAYNSTLAVIVYGVPEGDPRAVQSGLRGYSLAQTMYPRDYGIPGRVFPGGTDPNPFTSLSPFSGTGLFTAADGTALDQLPLPIPGAPAGFYYLRSQVVNYAAQPGGPYFVDPEWEWFRDSTGAIGLNYPGPGYTGAPNSPRYRSMAAPYTYPDHKDYYLAVFDHSDITSTPGAVQKTGQIVNPSYYRSYGPFRHASQPATDTGLEPTNPNWFSAEHRLAIVRPRPIDQIPAAELTANGLSPNLPVNMAANDPRAVPYRNYLASSAVVNGLGGIFPPPMVNSDGTVTGDVQNIPNAQGLQRADAIWIYPGGPVMSWKGKKYVAMVAPTIIDLSGRVNLSVAGNKQGTATDPQGPLPQFPPVGTLIPLGRTHSSYAGYSPTEVNPLRIFSLAANDANDAATGVADIRRSQRALLQLLGGGDLAVPFGAQSAPGRYGYAPAGSPRDPGSVNPPTDALVGATGNQAYYNGNQIPPHYSRVKVGNLPGTGTDVNATNRPDVAGGGAAPFPTFTAGAFYDTTLSRDAQLQNHPVQLNPDFAPQFGSAGRVFSFDDLRRMALGNRTVDKAEVRANNYAAYYGQTELATLAPWQLGSGNFLAKSSTSPYPDVPYNPSNPQGSAFGNPAVTTSDPALLARMLTTTFSTSLSRPEVVLRTGPVPASGGPAPTARLGPVDVTRPLHDFRVNTTVTDPVTMVTSPAPLSQQNMLPTYPGGYNDDPTTHAPYRQYALARRDRQNLARDIFVRLAALLNLVDGTAVYYDPTTAYLRFGSGMTAPTPQTINTLRACAQVAANVVDYTDPDDINTAFVWNPVLYPDAANPGSFLLYNDTVAAAAAVPAEATFYDPSADLANFAAATLGDHVVFGTELPRVALNEVYAGLFNNRKDLGGAGMAQNELQMRFWLELHNPLTTPDNDLALSDNGAARLQFPANAAANYSAYPVHEIVISRHDAKIGNNEAPDRFSQQLTTPGSTNVTGDPVQAGLNVRLRVTDFTPSASAVWSPTAGVDTNLARPCRGNTSDTVGGNQGYYVLAPRVEDVNQDGYPGGDVGATNRLPFPPDTAQAQPVNAMAYAVGTNTDTEADRWPTQVTHTALLRRLANPYLPPNDPNITTALPGIPAFDPMKPYVNPFITIDFVERVPTRDQVFVDSVGAHKNRTYTAGKPNSADKSPSIGRRHPYAAGGYAYDPNDATWVARAYDDAPGVDNSATNTVVNQMVQRQQIPVYPPAGATTPTPQPDPHNTFFAENTPFTDAVAGVAPTSPARWLVHMDRQLLNSVELAHVSAVSPALLTQQFGTNVGTTTAAFEGRFNTHTIESALLPGLPNGAARFDRFVMSPQTANAVNGEVQKERGFLNAALGLLTTRPAYYGAPVGGREHGRININTAARVEVLKALFDANGGNFFGDMDVYDTNGGAAMPTAVADGFWDRLTAPPTPMSISSSPTRNFATGSPVWAIGGPQTSANQTVLRPGGVNNNPLFYNRATFPNTAAPLPSDKTHATALTEPLAKVWNSSTTTSNSFLVVMTVGFFEVRPPAPGAAPGPDANGRVFLGKEMFKDVSGDLRQKFVSVVDRTNLGVEVNGTSTTGVQPAPAPLDQGKVWFTTLVEDAMPGATQIKIAAADLTSPSGLVSCGAVFADGIKIPLIDKNLPRAAIRVGFGDAGVAESKSDGEWLTMPAYPAEPPAVMTVAQVISWSGGVATITLGGPVQRYHPAGSPVSNIVLGNPGPQPAFDPASPRYRPVVPYTVQVTPTPAP